MIALILFHVTLAFIVFCADGVSEERRSTLERLARAAFWMVTLVNWFTHRNLVKLGRFGGVVWFLVTTGWLLTLEHDRVATPVFLLLAESTMAFIVYCVDALNSDVVNRPWRRLLRSLFWPLPLARYLSDEDTVALVQASVTVWVLLTTGWLLGLLSDRVVAPLAGAG